jgi:putative FmdB family regulatory protein
MPFYEYHCTKCGHHHEELQKISDPPLKKCPECGRNSLTRLVSAPVFRLKGGGWYETDFKSDQEGKRNLAVEKDEAPKPAADKPAETAAKPAEAAAAPKPAKVEAPSKSAAKATGRTAGATAKPAATRKPAAKAAARKAPARPAARGKRR